MPKKKTNYKIIRIPDHSEFYAVLENGRKGQVPWKVIDEMVRNIKSITPESKAEMTHHIYEVFSNEFIKINPEMASVIEAARPFFMLGQINSFGEINEKISKDYIDHFENIVNGKEQGDQ